MNIKDINNIPRYERIALELASRIANGEYEEGQKISGRSSIAGQYGVSPETARRAFSLLDDMGIVTPYKGSGMYVVSRKKAEEYTQRFSMQSSIEHIKDSINEIINRQKQEMNELDENLSTLMNMIEHYRSTNPLMPSSVRITDECRFIGKSVNEIKLWQYTGATMVAIRRDGELILSPGPYAVIKEGDRLYFISHDVSNNHIRDYLYGTDDDTDDSDLTQTDNPDPESSDSE